MRQKDQHFHSILDIYAFRVVADNVDNCYCVLGRCTHCISLCPKRVKDYIAVPNRTAINLYTFGMIGPHGTGGGTDSHRRYGQNGGYGGNSSLALQRGRVATTTRPFNSKPSNGYKVLLNCKTVPAIQQNLLIALNRSVL